MTSTMSDSPARAAGGGPHACWRIDDLAHRAGVTVDTIRYYQRERLLPPAERFGRANLYGPQHLERLDRIRELQARRFSLAAIRALLGEDRPGLVEGIFADPGGTSYSFDELVDRSGVDRALAESLRAAGLLRDPTEVGREAYDAEDLELLRAMVDLHGLGIPDKALVEIARIYAAGMEAAQLEIVELFTNGGHIDWSDDELHDFQQLAARSSAEILPRARRLVDYAHHRTIQRLTLGAIERGTIPPPRGP
jgi:DNA-binding transcriptional MerR regulator